MTKPHCYDIVDVIYIENLLEKENRTLYDYDEQLESNACYIYSISSGEVLLLPNEIEKDKKGIIFKDIVCLNFFIAEDRFPIENSKRNIYESRINDFLKLPEGMKTYEYALSEKLNLIGEPELVNMNFIEKCYSNIISSRDYERLFHSTFIEMGILIGELIRKEKGGEWALIKEYGEYNPYYIPVVVSKEGLIYEVFPFYERHPKSKNIASLIKTIDSDLFKPTKSISLFSRKYRQNNTLILY